MFKSIEICAGAGGQALGVEQAGFAHQALVEIDKHCCQTLRNNRPTWNVVEGDLCEFSAKDYANIDLIAGGAPCPPFSKAGKQLGVADERNLFPEAIRLVKEARPKAVMFENVRGIFDSIFEDYRKYISGEIAQLGYMTDWKLLNASDFGVPQLRPRVVFVAVRNEFANGFSWPIPTQEKALTVGEALFDLMSASGWRQASSWKAQADQVAPTLVGGSKKHGGPDLGPTRAKKAWANLGVDGKGVANEPPERDFVGMPRLTVKMTARVQGFPDDWVFSGKKTPQYRQIGNAFPPPVACAVARQIARCLDVKSLLQEAS